MRVVMKAYHTTADGAEYRPGDHVEFEDAEAARQVSIGGARPLTSAEEEALAEAASQAARAAAHAGLEAKTVDELKTFAADHQIDLQGSTKKADIIAAIELAQQSADQT